MATSTTGGKYGLFVNGQREFNKDGLFIFENGKLIVSMNGDEAEFLRNILLDEFPVSEFVRDLPMSDEDHDILFSADPGCTHRIHRAGGNGLGSGIECEGCGGWSCY